MAVIRDSRSLALRLILAVAATTLAPAAAADIYKYVDKHGRVTLTDTAKNSQYKRLVKTWKGWEESKSGIALQNFEKNRKKYTTTIDFYAKHYQLPPSLLHAVITAESAYDPDAVSKAGAVGLMQLMPETARRYGVRNRTNPSENVSGGTRYLRDLLQMFNNNLALALAAYNAGESAVVKHGHQIPPYNETRSYVKKVVALYQQYRKSMS
ncbi:MAG: lytic transglycosylase domain-containing protein [Gammaproteobacteria bacterium]|nr:lytic transglycosylase domain-containing protein [Gammaproteobacteria bacterium]